MTLFDADYLPGEQIPRGIEVHFLPVVGRSGPAAQMIVNGFPLSPALCDRTPGDGWRWRGAASVALAVCLGWSPVLRRMTGIRRRAVTEDSSRRAVAAEQRIVELLRGQTSVTPQLAEQAAQMAQGLEAGVCAVEDWEHALATAVECMTFLREYDGGVLLGDLHIGILAPIDERPAPVETGRAAALSA